MPLPSRIIAANPAVAISSPALRFDERSVRGFFTAAVAHESAKLFMSLFPVPVLYPLREVVAAYSLGNAALDQIEDRGEHSPFPIAGRSTELSGLRYQ